MTDESPRKAAENSEIVLQLRASARSVQEARHAAGDLCRSAGLASLADDAELLTSELVTNACQATENPITVALQCDASGFGVTVTDDDDDTVVAVPTMAPDDDALSGRGLHIVDKIASDWGAVQHDAHGKSVWFRLNTTTLTR